MRPYQDVSELMERSSTVFHRVDPQLGEYFDTMRQEGLLDLDSRKNKAPSGYCTSFPASGRPFIFMVGSGTRQDVETVMHEGGHAFHIFESEKLPYSEQRAFGSVPMEFAEVGSMAVTAYPISLSACASSPDPAPTSSRLAGGPGSAART